MNWLELSRIANQRVMLGLGEQRVMLDKRGIDLTQQEIELNLPKEGDRMSADGLIGYLSGRVVEY